MDAAVVTFVAVQLPTPLPGVAAGVGCISRIVTFAAPMRAVRSSSG